MYIYKILRHVKQKYKRNRCHPHLAETGPTLRLKNNFIARKNSSDIQSNIVSIRSRTVYVGKVGRRYRATARRAAIELPSPFLSRSHDVIVWRASPTVPHRHLRRAGWLIGRGERTALYLLSRFGAVAE